MCKLTATAYPVYVVGGAQTLLYVVRVRFFDLSLSMATKVVLISFLVSLVSYSSPTSHIHPRVLHRLNSGLCGEGKESRKGGGACGPTGMGRSNNAQVVPAASRRRLPHLLPFCRRPTRAAVMRWIYRLCLLTASSVSIIIVLCSSDTVIARGRREGASGVELGSRATPSLAFSIPCFLLPLSVLEASSTPSWTTCSHSFSLPFILSHLRWAHC
jgi:hypothetical protein